MKRDDNVFYQFALDNYPRMLLEQFSCYKQCHDECKIVDKALMTIVYLIKIRKQFCRVVRNVLPQGGSV